jgi:uncharacterized protein
MASEQRLLLDINVWLALLDERHVHHRAANGLIQRPGVRIATCTLVENGVLRIMAMPSYFLGQLSFSAIRDMLRLVCAQTDHAFWPDDLSLRGDDVIDWSRVSGHNQITDAYLLALAVAHGGAFASFDQRIARSAVRGAQAEHLVLL